MANINTTKTPAPAPTKAAVVPTKAVAPTKTPAPVKHPIAASSRSLKGLPKISMLATIAKITGHNGQGNRKKRYGLYKVGTSLLQANQATNGTSAIEIQYYATHRNAGSKVNLMVLAPCSPAAYKTFVTKWRTAKANNKPLPNKA